MELETMKIVVIIYGAVLVIQNIFLFWFGKLVYTQKSVVDSFKAQSGGVKDLQDMLLRQYKPETFENFANAKDREFEMKYQGIIGALKDSNKVMAKELMDTVSKYRHSYYSLVGMCALFKLFHSDSFGLTVELLKIEKYELDEIEKLREKMKEKSIRVDETTKTEELKDGQND